MRKENVKAEGTEETGGSPGMEDGHLFPRVGCEYMNKKRCGADSSTGGGRKQRELGPDGFWLLACK